MLSIIIGHRENSLERKKNLVFLVDYYHWLLKDIKHEIVIVEQDSFSKMNYTLINVKKIFVKNNNDYNRSWGFNIGIINSNYENILCIDNDIIFKKEEIDIGLKNLNQTKVWIPYEWFWDLNVNITNQFKKSKNFNLLTDKNNITERYNNVDSEHQLKFGGAFMVKRNFYLEYPFMDEEFQSYGAEDETAFFIFSKILYNMRLEIQPRNKNGNMYHLYHQRVDYVKLRENINYQKNCVLMNKIREMTYEQTINYINSYKNNIGNLYKYENN